MDLSGKAISDPIYGNIQLTRLESDLISSQAFQRLHNVKQLGLGHLVFPSAAYSRFSHSIGACANVDRMLTAIERNSTRRFTKEERQAFRLAALFHDLGHYPFSRTTEHAVKLFYSKQQTRPKAGGSDPDDRSEPVTFLEHEDVGAMVFDNDAEIQEILKRHGASKNIIREVLLDAGLATMISSDLDCDRLDYLRRTALHSGAPYGAVDVDFLISKATVDAEGRFCFGHKASRAADHLLISRFYDFMQIPYHKTVAALEWSLEQSLTYLMSSGQLDLSEAGVGKLVEKQSWWLFDDVRVLEMLKRAFETLDHSENQLTIDHIRAVLHRRPAKAVYMWERLSEASSNEGPTRQLLVELEIEKIAGKLDLPKERFHIWTAPFKLTKAGPMLNRMVGSESQHSDEEAAELIHLLERGQTIARPLIDAPNTVSHHLARLRYQTVRVYLLPSEKIGSEIIEKARRMFGELPA